MMTDSPLSSDDTTTMFSSSTLPQLAHIMTLHKTQDEDLQHKNNTLVQLEDLIDKELLTQKEIHDNLRKVNKELRISQETSGELESICKEKTKEMNSRVTNVCRLKQTLELIEEEKYERDVTIEEYKEKMSIHVSQSSKDIQSRDIKHETETLQTKIKQLKTLYMDMDKEQLVKEELEIDGKIQNRQEERESLTIETRRLLNEIEMLEKNVEHISSEILVAKKRNHAQLTRLHHQLKEAQGKQQHWVKEKLQLITSIKELKQSIIEE